ncbi:serine protease [Neorhodopirellula pilleata]|uniref:Subtilase-type serine protease n=1 Tax=Neorhodopirellula pilleata TaxID=2714738 RepID=A0A5C6ARA6_9BACT|nr:serine protease [Neorhodopirellula pilleata]TWU02098.1 hypothetical protein Pla100_18380 [Neorhodopirellula pilleata]
MKRLLTTCVCLALLPTAASAQSVCLPSPRLLTMMPMGGQVGTQCEVVITGQYLDGIDQLIFSHPSISAVPKVNEQGELIDNTFVISIADDCPAGVYDARVMAGLGISSARAFSVGERPETTHPVAATTAEQAIAVELDSIVNATLKDRSISHFSIVVEQGQRIVIDCAAKGIDSKANVVIALADATGSDLIVERRGGVIDFVAPTSGTYLVKVHDLTYKGGAEYFYRLAITRRTADEPLERLPSTSHVASFSWPPTGLPDHASNDEVEPNNTLESSQLISLPCDLTGTFFPAADVDSFEFQATKGQRWWVEVASERFGLNTDPSLVVQRITDSGEVVDVVELADIPSPVKRSSNGYSYDGPPYNAGSSDALGELVVPEDGRYRIRLSDLFGGTRSDPTARYRLVVREAAPDFALVGWALHMGLRNGDRNALSKPISLRGGATIPIEVVAVRRDGFDGEIELEIDPSSLPEGVTATGLKIAKGATRGIMLIAADPDAVRTLSFGRIVGKAKIAGHDVVRPFRLASMKWPVANAAQEIPEPRLVDQIPISVGGMETSPLSILPVEDKVWEVQEGEKLTIPLKAVRHGEFSGKNMSLKTFGDEFERAAAFDFSLVDDQTVATLDLAAIKAKPGDHTIAFYGGAVAVYGFAKEKPKDIVDIFVSKPIHVRVLPKQGTSP